MVQAAEARVPAPDGRAVARTRTSTPGATARGPLAPSEDAPPPLPWHWVRRALPTRVLKGAWPLFWAPSRSRLRRARGVVRVGSERTERRADAGRAFRAWGVGPRPDGGLCRLPRRTASTAPVCVRFLIDLSPTLGDVLASATELGSCVRARRRSAAPLDALCRTCWGTGKAVAALVLAPGACLARGTGAVRGTPGLGAAWRAWAPGFGQLLSSGHKPFPWGPCPLRT